MAGIVYMDVLGMSMVSGLLSEPFFLKNNLNPLMIPCLESGKGSCQDAMIIVDVFAVTVNLLGAFDGTKRFQIQQRKVKED